ncbi:MAG: potassium channel family protein [Acidimicrobiales bacterium]
MEPTGRVTSSPPTMPFATTREWHRELARVFMRAGASLVVVLAVFYLLPLDHDVTAAWGVAVAAGLMAIGVVVVIQLRRIITSEHPVQRAIEALALSIPLFVVVFASIYVVFAHQNPGAFSEGLSHTGSLYFTITVLSTTGFGDITPVSDTARLIVSAQMVIDLILIGLVIKTIMAAVRLGMQRRFGTDDVLGSGRLAPADHDSSDPSSHPTD